MATVPQFMTEEEFLALPDDDGVERELIRGVLRERPSMTTRGCAHTVVTTNISCLLKVWQKSQAHPRGWVMTGDARIRIRLEPTSFVGADFAYIPAETRPSNPRKARNIEGPPLLIIEILSPSDKQEDIADKVSEYLDAGVPLVWIVDPRFSTVIVHRPDARPQLFNVDQEITAEPHLPGFRVAVADFFEDLDD